MHPFCTECPILAFVSAATILGGPDRGVPSVALCPNSMSDTDFDRLLDKTVAWAADHPRLILGIADTTPANACFARLLKVTERVKETART